MNVTNTNELDNQTTIDKVCDFFKLKNTRNRSDDLKDTIKELCVNRLCKVIGVTGVYNYKSHFFEFFSNVMGEAVCEKLSINTHIAGDEIRFVKYEHINLVNKTRYFLENESMEDAFLDVFKMIDKYKYLIPKLKKKA